MASVAMALLCMKQEAIKKSTETGIVVGMCLFAAVFVMLKKERE